MFEHIDPNAPYVGAKAEHWERRTFSPEYQRAYDQIVAEIARKGVRGSVLVEFACGLGEMLKRVHQARTYRTLIGTDSSLDMLAKARANLQTSGIETRMCTDASELDYERPGVQLVIDDIRKSQLPSSVADLVVFTFPEIRSPHQTEDPVDDFIIRRCLEVGYPCDRGDYNQMIEMLRSEYHQSRIGKIGRQQLSTTYAATLGKKSALRAAKEMKKYAEQMRGISLKMFREVFGDATFFQMWRDLPFLQLIAFGKVVGTEYVDQNFYASAGIDRDVTSQEEGTENAQKGFRTIWMKKVEHVEDRTQEK